MERIQTNTQGNRNERKGNKNCSSDDERVKRWPGNGQMPKGGRTNLMLGIFLSIPSCFTVVIVLCLNAVWKWIVV